MQEASCIMKVGDLVFHKSFNHWGVGILVRETEGYTYKIWWQSGFETIDHFYNLRLVKENGDWIIAEV